jgi:hypothetical protein
MVSPELYEISMVSPELPGNSLHDLPRPHTVNRLPAPAPIHFGVRASDTC